MTRSTLRRAAAVLCVSSDLAEIAKRLGARPQNIRVIRNGVDSRDFCFRTQDQARAALKMQTLDRLVLFVGWLSPSKGVPQLLEAIALLNRRGGRGWRLALAGEGHLEGLLRRRAQALGIQNRVEFLGALSRHQVANWMTACDCLCLPSESEGCPNVVVEALSCGAPVVANAVGGVPELLNERSGVLMRCNQSQAIAEALEEADRRPWDRPRIARENCRTWDQVGRETYEVCAQVIGKSTHAPVEMRESIGGTRG